MDLSLAAVDFDGTLGNPVVRVAVTIWAAVLGILLIVVFTYVRRAWQRLFLTFLILAIGYGFSRIACLGLAASYYEATAKKPIGVGFFGGPPPWVAPLLALSLAGFAALVLGRRARGTAP